MSNVIIPTTGEIIVDLQGINLSFGETVVIRDLDATIYDLIQEGGRVRGQINALLAPSGMGKTQLFRIMSGLQKPSSGTVHIGTDKHPPEPSKVGVVAQHYPLLSHRTVLGNLIMAQNAFDRTKDEKRKAAMEMLERFGLTDRADYYPAQLSGGQRQRVAIAQQLLCSKQLILMDEPFSGLDPLAVTEVINLIIEVANEDEHNTIVVVTHDVSAAVAVADTVWLMGRDRDDNGEPIPGAKIQRTYDLIPDGYAWIDGDVRHEPGFHELVMEIEAEFQHL